MHWVLLKVVFYVKVMYKTIMIFQRFLIRNFQHWFSHSFLLYSFSTETETHSVHFWYICYTIYFYLNCDPNFMLFLNHSRFIYFQIANMRLHCIERTQYGSLVKSVGWDEILAKMIHVIDRYSINLPVLLQMEWYVLLSKQGHINKEIELVVNVSYQCAYF
jgi:hypothetical protein